MKRRVVLHGPATLTISLPSYWIKKHHVRKGDELQLEEKGKTLWVSIDKKSVSWEKTVVDFRGLGEYAVNTLLPVLHKLGYDEIEILFDNQKMFAIIKERVYSMLIGFEIVEETVSSCVIKSMSTNEESEFQQFFRRTFLVAVSVAEQTARAIEEKSSDAFHDILSLEESSNRLTNYAERLINKCTYERSTNFYVLIWLLESMCDDYKHIINYLKANRACDALQILLYFKKLAVLLRDFYEFFYKYSDEALDRFKKELMTTQEEIFLAMKRFHDCAVPLAYMHTLVERIADSLASTAGLHH